MSLYTFKYVTVCHHIASSIAALPLSKPKLIEIRTLVKKNDTNKSTQLFSDILPKGICFISISIYRKSYYYYYYFLHARIHDLAYTWSG